jgi:deoxycytidylate deaminase
MTEYSKFLERCDWYAHGYLCTHRDVGAVVVKGNEIVSYGRNTMPGSALCVNGGCPRGLLPKDQGNPDYSDCVAVHAEMNAIVKAGLMLCRGGLIVVNSVPCHLCLRLARGAELALLVYRDYDMNIHEVKLI